MIVSRKNKNPFQKNFMKKRLRTMRNSGYNFDIKERFKIFKAYSMDFPDLIEILDNNLKDIYDENDEMYHFEKLQDMVAEVKMNDILFYKSLYK